MAISLWDHTWGPGGAVKSRDPCATYSFPTRERFIVTGKSRQGVEKSWPKNKIIKKNLEEGWGRVKANHIFTTPDYLS